MIRSLKTAGVGLLLVIGGLAAIGYMGSQGLTGSAAFVALAVVVVGAFSFIRGAVLAIWGAIARSRA